MAGTVIADAVQAASTSQLVIKNGVALTPPTIQDVNGTQIGTFCRAWVNFDGSNAFSPNPSTSAIRGAFNVSSITDGGTGNFTINFTNAMPDVNYAVTSFVTRDGTANSTSIPALYAVNNTSQQLTTSLNVRTGSPTTAAVDWAGICIAIFR